MATPAQTPTLAQAIKSKYPGVYDDMDDMSLESKILQKYPQYGDMPRTQMPQSTATIGAAETGVLPWLKNLEGDVRYGSNMTVPGRLLHKMGMQATTAGVSPGTEQMIASPVNGPIHAAQGAAQIPSQPWEGTKKLVGGALETAQLPSMFIAPEGAEAASSVPSFLKNLIPSTERAGKNFQAVAGAAKQFGYPVKVTDELSGALNKYQDLVDAGGSQSLSVRKLLNRVTNPSKGPLTYEESRNFYSNLSRLSADESSRLTPVMKRQVGEVTRALGNSVQRTATLSGKGAEYSGAMKEYAKASKFNNAMSDAGDYLTKQALQKLPWLASLYAGKKIYDATK